jgi:hypothetical protein
MIILTFGIVPDFKYHSAYTIAAPPNGTKLIWIVIALVHQISLVENLSRLLETNAMFSSDGFIFCPIEVKARI